MAEAARTLDLTGVLSVLDVYRKIAEITGGRASRRIGGCWTESPASSAARMCPSCQGVSTKQRSTRGWVTNGVYSYDILPEVREQVDGLPAQALPCGQPGRQHAEDGLWAGAEGIAV
jgi:hypothetical protein